MLVGNGPAKPLAAYAITLPLLYLLLTLMRSKCQKVSILLLCMVGTPKQYQKDVLSEGYSFLVH